MQCIVIEKAVLFNILCMHDAAEDICVQHRHQNLLSFISSHK